MRRAVITSLFAAVLVVPVSAAPAVADEVVVVPGTAFPTGAATYLARFGCQSIYHVDATDALAEVVLDDGAPLGRRALSFQVPVPGGATGPVTRVASVATATHQLSARARQGATGVAWVWFATADLAAGEVWLGRADLVAAVGGWQRLDPGAATYTWSRVEAATGTVLEDAGSADVAGFTQAHGDGPGYLLSGLGCDGRSQVLDEVSVGPPGAVTTFDLEAAAVTTSITTSAPRVEDGQAVTLTGTSTDSRRHTVGAALVLQARPEGADTFRDVTDPLAARGDGSVEVRVTPTTTTTYRWWFAERPYADAHPSPEVTVQVVPRTATATPPPPLSLPEPSQPEAPQPPSTQPEAPEPEAPQPESTQPAPEEPEPATPVEPSAELLTPGAPAVESTEPEPTTAPETPTEEPTGTS